MADEEKGVSTPIIDEVLCFIQNKIGLINEDHIIQLCEETFEKEAIGKSKELFFEMCHKEGDKTVNRGRTGEHKSERNLKDICSLFQEKGKSAPEFCAKDLNILPPVTLKDLDASSLLKSILQLKEEVKALRTISAAQQEINEGLLDKVKTLEERVSDIESPDSATKPSPENVVSAVSTVPEAIPERNTSNVVNVVDVSSANGGPSTLNPGAASFAGRGAPRPEQQSYATVLLNNGGNVVDSDGFVTVGRNGKPIKPVSAVQQRNNSQVKKRSPKQGMVGSSTRSGIVAAPRFVKSSVFVTRYPPGMTAEGVKNDLLLDERVRDLDIKVEPVLAKHNSYTSFHVTCVCKESDAKIFLGPDLWPSGIFYRQWREKRIANARGANVHNLQPHNNGFRQRNAGYSYSASTHGRNGHNRQRRESL